MAEGRIKDELALVVLVSHLSRAYRRVVNRALAVHGLSEAQAKPVLLICRLGKGVRQGVLAEQLGIEGPSLARQIDQLQATGLVERHADPLDGRAKTLHLTEAGRAFANLIEKRLDAWRTQLLAPLNDSELASAVSTLQAFEKSVAAALNQPLSID
jgi:MarR family transcriptional regulator for hemolysin